MKKLFALILVAITVILSFGIVNVSAKDKGTNKEQHITITSGGNMSKEDIERAVKDAEKFAEEDKKRREEVDSKNEAENMCYAVEKLLKDNEGKIDAADKDSLNSKGSIDFAFVVF